MIQLGLIGYPLGHSLSPQIQTAALQACNLEGDYSLFPIHPDDKQALEDLLSRVRIGEIQGLNVTIPHKQNVIPYLDELTPTAHSIGAVNTIYMREDKLMGDNTDAPGFLNDLNRFLGNRKSQIENRKSSIVLGAGGSARAVVYALLNDDWNVTLVARRTEQAHQLALSFPEHEIHTMHYESITLLSPREAFSLLVNTTPVGMTPNIDKSPWPEDVDFPPHAAIYDLVYNPRETKLVRDARSQGRLATTGLGMLIEQAALAFKIWTGCKPPRDVMFEADDQPAH
jgi:shikimate dehydrogenase